MRKHYDTVLPRFLIQKACNRYGTTPEGLSYILGISPCLIKDVMKGNKRLSSSVYEELVEAAGLN